MDHKQQKEIKHNKERKEERKEAKASDAIAEKTRPIIHPAWVVVVGVVLVVLIVVSWIFLF